MKINFNDKNSFFLFAGPCVLEEKEIVFQIAEFMQKTTLNLGIPYVFKASFSKANRTSVNSYSGPGLDKGLKILSEVKKEFNLPIVTDIHEAGEAALVAEVADILQIPAFLSRQTFLLKAAAETGKIVNVKKAQFMAPEDMIPVVEKLKHFGSKQTLVTERGTSFGYHNLVVDFRGFMQMKQTGCPVVYDVTHSLQRPSQGNSSGGNPEFANMMAKAAIATGQVQGLFIETHPNPKEAKSDASTMLSLEKTEQLLIDCKRIWDSAN